MDNNSSKTARPVLGTAQKNGQKQGVGSVRQGLGAACFGLFWLVLAGQVCAEASSTAMAGLQPFARPAGAPTLTQFNADAAWQAKALTGIATPYTGLGFLKDQGAWFTPFNHPSLKGGYDIRGLYAAREQAHLNKPNKAQGN